MKYIWWIPISILGLTIVAPTISWAQKIEPPTEPYLGEYQVQAHCTLENGFWHEENHSYTINLEPLDEDWRIYRFYLPQVQIQDYVRIQLFYDNSFRLLREKFYNEWDSTDITFISGNGILRNDSIFMEYYMASTTAYGALVCDCKGARSGAAVETPSENPAVYWRLSPQPATERVQAVCEAAEVGLRSGNWRLVDAGGKALRHGTFSNGRFDISLSGIPTSLYLIEITATNGSVCRLKCVSWHK